MKKRGTLGDAQKKQYFGIRKLKVGVASVAIATALLFLVPGNVTVYADDADAAADIVQVESLQPLDSSSDVGQQDLTADASDNQVIDTQEDLLVQTPAQSEVVSVAENTDVKPADSNSVQDQVADATTIPENELQVESVNLASQTEASQSKSNQTIAEDTIRVHFEDINSDEVDQYGLWTWGEVAEPSDGNQWPSAAAPFSAENKDDYGHFIDVKQAESHGDIGYLLLKDGEKVVEGDQKIQPLTSEMNEVWVTKDFATYAYQPLADDSIIRINYKRDDDQYDGWGVWLWGDVAQSSATWPTDALDFSNVGAYGRYVDVPLSNLLDSKIGFLLVNQLDPEAPGNKTLDMNFSNRATHSQIFLRNDDDTVYTNPYYIATVEGQDFSKAEPGTHNVSVSASSYRDFNYNELGLIDVELSNPNNVEITRMEVDTSAIGGGVIQISTELNRVTITASSTVVAGDYTLPVRVYDVDNGYYDGSVSVHITERNKTENEKDWDEQVIYFMLTDRFYNGDTSNDNPYNQDYAGAVNQEGVYKGGDFKGVTEKLDYLKDLGVTSIWVTPIVENVPQNVSTDSGKEYYAYHGYWAEDFEKLNPHLGTLEDFHRLIDEAASRGINIIVDVVLNHAGYGAEDKFQGLVRTAEEDKAGDDEKGSLSNLPDFKTEEEAVREKLVAWQSDWLRKSTTAAGNSIYAFRVDTVKHVDDVTWQHFKNELALKDSDFHLVGESWGASYKDTKGDLGTGTMDSLLDFGFKETAKLLVNGRLKQASEEMGARNDALSSNYTLAQFLGSHDEDGFLYSIGGDVNKLKLAATALITSKGQPVIYYGEEIGQTGQNNWPYYDNRYEFDWDKTADNDLLTHYKKLLAFRNDNSELLSRGDYETLAVSDSQQWLIAKRDNGQDAAYIVYNLKDAQQELRLEVGDGESSLTDFYSGEVYLPSLAEDGKWYVDLATPSSSNGGTMLLKVSSGLISSAISLQAQEEKIQEGSIRIHFKALPEGEVSSLGLWLWDDVETPSDKVAGWPSGATSFSEARQDDYGYYLDVRLSQDQRSKLSFLINNTKGDNLTGDRSVELISQDMNEVWIDENFASHYYQPLAPGTLRINYYRSDGQYENLSLWLWGSADASITSQLGNWPDGVDFENIGKYGVYMDIPLSDLNELGFLLLDESKEGDAAKIQAENYIFKDLQNQTQIFLKDDDKTIYTNPYFTKTVRMTGAQQIAADKLLVFMTNIDDLDTASLSEEMQVTDTGGNQVVLSDLAVDTSRGQLILTGDFGQAQAPYTISFLGDQFTAKTNWQYTDSLYDYSGELGARVGKEGQVVDFTVWSPSADAVALVLYDKDNQDKVLGEVAMTKGDKGQWSTTLTADSSFALDDYRGYYYHYKITRGNQDVLVLDPYAKSLAAWNSELADSNPSYKVAKAAIVDSSAIGIQDLDFATIEGYQAREDAIIYEAHVRDFTSDVAIADELVNQFGTFAAFVEKLDYLQELGVTHIQLLPVMSYYYVNELANGQRLTDYDSSDTNYNWGYDPQSYFALTGMYSTDPSDPAKRIEEFKNLVNEIHKRGMGVILDVVYNHTAKVDLFEDLEPNYYHFMDASGTAKTSFGGGRLGTTHYMTRRLLVDSITYLVDTFKVDGFRFDMMGDHDAAAIQAAYDAAKALNPNIIMLGEGWVTYAGDDNMPEQAADQTWMSQTDSVASFSDDIRNNLKSGYPNEGQPAFITGGAKDLATIFSNIKAQPTNFEADDPGDVIQYIAAHDNLTLFDIIAQSIKKDPSVAENYEEIHRRLRLGNTIVLTSQGTIFLHSGQEYGRTKQFKDEAYKAPVSDDQVPNKSHLLVNEDGTPFEYPYFIHDSYDSTDAINHFDWAKATDSDAYPVSTQSQAYTKGLIALRRSTDAFSLKTKEEVDQKVQLLTIPGQHGIGQTDLVIAYQTQASNGDVYAVFINADSVEREFYLDDAYRALLNADVLVDGSSAGIVPIENPIGVTFSQDGLKLAPLTAIVLRLSTANQEPDEENQVSPERSLYHEASQVTVILAAGESDAIVGLQVSHMETNDSQTPAVLKGHDFDLFDITLVDKDGQKLDISKPARVIMPVDDGKTVAKVFYLPDNGPAQDLDFEELTESVDGQERRFVAFTAEHFSNYGLVYQVDEQTPTDEDSDDQTQSENEGPTSDPTPQEDPQDTPDTTTSNAGSEDTQSGNEEPTSVPEPQAGARGDRVSPSLTSVTAPKATLNEKVVSKTNQALPQTGEKSSLALAALGVTMVLGTTALAGKRKEDD
ncbi:pullulanase, extracellular [Streptococcus henryi]|uniref:pullulanase n=1 Tax=Streptococcus henryi TaxID=439219 RepID=A0A1G6CHI2_9STRE|nr:pullulanase [Streptococcus henryi]SDB32245.1 pullulanase, extracellular [Streptococcus henryi]